MISLFFFIFFLSILFIKNYSKNLEVKDAKEIGMMQFEVKYTRRPGKDLLIYNRKIVRELFNYCDKPARNWEGINV